MAEVQQSGPLVGQNFTDAVWRALFGGEPAIVGDTDGTAYDLTLPPASDSVELGSASIESKAVVGGFGHAIPAGTTQSLEIPASSNPTVGRTDLIVVRLDPTAFDTEPGPVRLHRLAGTEGSAARPAYDQGPPGAEDMPLYAITRKQGEALTQADVVDLRVRSGPHLLAKSGVSPFPSMPLGSTATRNGITYRRDLSATGSPTWVSTIHPLEVLTGLAATASAESGWQRQSSCRLVRHGDYRSLLLVARRTTTTTSNGSGGLGDAGVVRLHGQDRPPAGTPMAAYVKSTGGATYMAGVHVSGNYGLVVLNSTLPNITIGPAGPDDTLRAFASWYVA